MENSKIDSEKSQEINDEKENLKNEEVKTDSNGIVNNEEKENENEKEKEENKGNFQRVIVMAIKLFKKNFNRTIIIEQLISLVYVYLPLIFTFIYGRAIDSISKTNENTNFYCISYLTLLFGQKMIDISRDYLLKDRDNIQNDMKLEFFKNILEKDYSFFDKYSPGDILSKFTEDFYNFYYFRPSTILSNINDLISFILIIFYLLNTSVYLFFIYSSVFIYDFYKFKTLDVDKQWDKYYKQSDKVFKYTTEIITNIRLVKSFSTEKKEIKKLKIKFDDLNEMRKENMKNNTWRNRDYLEKTLDICGIWFAGYQIASGNMTIGGFTTFQLIFKQSTYIIPNLLREYSGIIEKVVKLEKIIELMEHDVLIKNNDNSIKKESMKAKIEFKDVSFSYPLKEKIKIIKNLNFSINEGETIALVGPSGCGKSTLSLLVQRLYDPQEGKIFIDGINLKDFDIEWLHNKIGFVSQEPILFADTIENNITYAVNSYNQEDLDRAAKLSHCYEFINNKEKFPDGYNTMLGDKGLTLSGGQKQRISIARALIKNVKILVFDEATSSLDSESESEVQKAIEEIISFGQITTIIIAHRLSTIKNCNRIFVLKDGEIAEIGNHNELLKKKGIYKSLIDKQLEFSLQKTNSTKSSSNLPNQ